MCDWSHWTPLRHAQESLLSRAPKYSLPTMTWHLVFVQLSSPRPTLPCFLYHSCWDLRGLLKCHVVLDFSIFTASFLLFFIPLRWLTPADLYRFSSDVPASRKASVLLGSLVPSLGQVWDKSVSPMLLWPCAYCMGLPQVPGCQRDPTWLRLSLRLMVNKDLITLISVWGQQLTESSPSTCVHGTRTDTASVWFCLFYLVLSFGLQRAQQALESVHTCKEKLFSLFHGQN